MFLKLITIFICFILALGSRHHPKIFNNVEEDFVRLNGEADFDDRSYDSSSSQDEGSPSKQDTCGKPSITPNTLQKIMGGEEAKPHSWPWQVSILHNGPGFFEHFCGGTIISATKIISAAHCFYNKQTRKPLKHLYVIAGIHNIMDSFSPTKSQTKKVIKLVPHNNYDPKLKYSQNDIAILYIASPGFKFNDKVQPVCLPSSEIILGSSCYTTGWGNINENQINENKTLHQARLTSIYYPVCSYFFETSIKSTMICAGYEEGSTCTGDGGGPFVCSRGGTWVFDGVVSWGNGCGNKNSLSVFTKVFDFLTWINSN